MGWKRWAWKAMIGWVVVLSIAYSALSILRHNHFQSGGFDLGIYDQVAWQYAHFQWQYNTKVLGEIIALGFVNCGIV